MSANSAKKVAALLFIVALIGCGAIVLSAAGQNASATQAQATQGPELPDTPLLPHIKTACLECHDSSILVQQRLDKKHWTAEVDKMIRWGATVDPKEHDAFVDYFSEHFSPGVEPYVPLPQAKK